MKNNYSGIVGLDLSITGSGVARYDLEEEKYTSLFTIGTGAKFGDQMQRIEFSAKRILSIIHQDDLVFVEDYAYGVGKGSQLASLAELGGVMKFLIYRKTSRIPVHVASTTIKKWFSGSGKLSHDDFKMEAYKKYKREFGTKDEVIAFSLCDFALCLVFPSYIGRQFYKYEEEVIRNFKKSHAGFS